MLIRPDRELYVMCRHSAAMDRGTLDCVDGMQLFGEERRRPLSWFHRNAPESVLSEMFVFDYTLSRSTVLPFLTLPEYFSNNNSDKSTKNIT